MNRTGKRWLFWTPRVVCMLFAAFISMFALDVFGEGYGFWKTILTLLIHLAPVGGLILFLAISWRWEWVGGIVFPALGMLYMVSAWGRFHWSVYVIIAGPLFVLGALFLLNWRYRAELRARG